MKIGIFGGTFDPVHLGHLQLARNALAQFSLNKVFFIPAFQPPHKQSALPSTSAQHRYEMVRLAIEGETSFEVSDCELKREGVSYTFDTLSFFEVKYPSAVFFLILGKDAFEGFSTWYRAAELKEKVRFLVANRGGQQGFMVKDACAELIQMPLCPISASGIRKAIQQGKNVGEYLPAKVLSYIQKNALYRKTEP